MKQKIKLSIIALAIVLLAMLPNRVMASTNCQNISDENVKYVNATLTKINREPYNAMQRGVHWSDYYNIQMEQRYDIDTKSMLMASTEGMCIGGIQNGYIGLGNYGNSTGVLQGLVKKTLVNDNLYVIDKYTNKDSFFPKSNTNSSVYTEFLKDWKMPFIKEKNGYYSFNSDKYHIYKDYNTKTLKLHKGERSGFYPFNNCQDNTSTMSNRELGFTVRMDIPFIMTEDGKVKNSETKQYEDMVFNFSGDDDVWVFVDDKLVLDLGGNHIKLTGNINFAKNQVYYESIYNPNTNQDEKNVYKSAFESGKLSQGKHTLKVFYMERAGGESNLFVTFNLQSGGIQTNHIDKSNGKILNTDSQSGPVGEKVTTSSINIDGYTLIQKPNTEEYTLTQDLQTVNYYYAKNSKVISKYIDEITKEEIDKRETINGKYGDKYETKQKNIENYEFTKVDGKTNGTMEGKDITVIYYYKRKSNVIVKYEDEITKEEIDKRETINGKYGDKYETKQKNIKNYEFTKVDGKTNGTMEGKDITVIYYYKHKSKIIVNYIDKETGEKLDNEEHIVYEGSTYTSEERKYEDYRLVEKPEKETVKVEKEDITLNYYYQKLKFNLQIQMNLEKALVNGNYYGLNGKVGKIETEIRDANEKSSLQIYYKIKVTNNEERIGSGYITFTIPEGYHMINQDWDIIENKAKYKVKDINIGETREYEVILEKNQGVDVAGDIKSYVRIDSEKLQETTLEDNEDMNELAVMPRTGRIILPLIPVIVSLIIIEGVIYIKKRKITKI